MNTILILFAMIVILAIFIVILAKIIKKTSKENEALRWRVAKQSMNIRVLLEHTRGLGEIQKENGELLRRIHNAQSDEDLDDIIGDIITRNNERVQDSTGNASGTAAEAEQRKAGRTERR